MHRPAGGAPGPPAPGPARAFTGIPAGTTAAQALGGGYRQAPLTVRPALAGRRGVAEDGGMGRHAVILLEVSAPCAWGSAA
ncbi:hypothetical protein JYK14_01565 [Siccirubricoccus sp. KC 17139]|uniref:Uncharacterized protein n=1 Tax=Siccirubricoccus soli TaxID=2899147 RepID=A0ABT1CYW2_9PROT|nr:hypothetical protein [Siccirubricoccus soli]MCO6414863.1 hypothetical protein [Siccirubricoccus soli]MCP2680993.1 hypothetical protein [Siccirubricoccus soli]